LTLTALVKITWLLGLWNVSNKLTINGECLEDDR
jgi:hypothetical protein